IGVPRLARSTSRARLELSRTGSNSPSKRLGTLPVAAIMAGVTATSERRAHLVMLAGDLFAEKGFRAPTVREIADPAGSLSRTLYHHFDSKESIADEILTSFLNDVLANYRTAAAEADGPRDALERIVRSSSGTLARHRAALTMLQNDWAYFSSQPRFGYLRD